jgi:hypothetical protein
MKTLSVMYGHPYLRTFDLKIKADLADWYKSLARPVKKKQTPQLVGFINIEELHHPVG